MGSTRTSHGSVPSSSRTRSSRTLLAALGGAGLLALSGCAKDTTAGRLGLPEPATEQGDTVLTFWQNSWIVAFIVGGVTLALILWCVVVYRRRRGDGLPRQVHYNLPMEILYTVVPAIILVPMLFFTVREQTELTKLTNDYRHTVNVVGYKWAWTFNYVDESAHDIGSPNSPAVLWLPVNEKTRFTLTSADVIHDFWVPAFLFKMDVIPGRKNQFELTPNRIGTYAGRCAELCGVQHSRMLFTVNVVTRAEYDAHIADIKARGQDGLLETGRVNTTGVKQ